MKFRVIALLAVISGSHALEERLQRNLWSEAGAPLRVSSMSRLLEDPDFLMAGMCLRCHRCGRGIMRATLGIWPTGLHNWLQLLRPRHQKATENLRRRFRFHLFHITMSHIHILEKHQKLFLSHCRQILKGWWVHILLLIHQTLLESFDCWHTSSFVICKLLKTWTFLRSCSSWNQRMEVKEVEVSDILCYWAQKYHVIRCISQILICFFKK
jgi:hypothetical protein